MKPSSIRSAVFLFLGKAMFVFRSTHNALLREHIRTLEELRETIAENAMLRSRLRDYRLAAIGNQRTALSKRDIDRLIRLCHPDRHGNSEASVEMTQKLLSMRK